MRRLLVLALLAVMAAAVGASTAYAQGDEDGDEDGTTTTLEPTTTTLEPTTTTTELVTTTTTEPTTTTTDPEILRIPECHVAYADCLVPNTSPDVDCVGGGGDGPEFVTGPVRLVGPDDPYDLDGDGDGVGCEVGDPAATPATTAAPTTTVTAPPSTVALVVPTTLLHQVVPVRAELAATSTNTTAWAVVLAAFFVFVGCTGLVWRNRLRLAGR
jgi:hypothetical protein